MWKPEAGVGGGGGGVVKGRRGGALIDLRVKSSIVSIVGEGPKQTGSQLR